MVTVAVLLQTIFLIAIALSVARMRKSFERFTADVHKFLEVAERGAELLNCNMAQVSQRVLKAGEMTDEFLAKSRAYALAFDKLIGEALRTAEYAQKEMEQIIRRCFRKVRALEAGLRAASGYLFPGRNSGASHSR